MKSIYYLLSILILTTVIGCAKETKHSYLSYIDTRVGTAPSTTLTAGQFGKKTEEFGQTLPAVLEPNGMNFWTPQTQNTEHKCIAPYYYRDTLLQGFRNSHWIVGGCTQDYGSFTLMPLSGELRFQAKERATPFSHKQEIATPSYYAVNLPYEAIYAEMTARSRSAIFRFTYRQEGLGHLVFEVNSDERKGFIAYDSVRHEVYGYNPAHRIYQGWGEAAGFAGHFIIELPAKEYVVRRPSAQLLSLTFEVKRDERVLLKAASSFVDREGAERNLSKEIPHWDFEQTRQELSSIWEERLSLLKVISNDTLSLQKFYGSIYRASFLPRTFNDVDGRYPSFATGNPIQQLPEGDTYYDDFSMWDTYRSLHPLLCLITPYEAGQMMQSLVLKYQQGGWLPIFPCWNSYTAAMIGDHCLSAISDAYIKGIRNFDINTAYEAMRKNAFETPINQTDYKNGMGRRALTSYLKHGYIPLEDKVSDAFHTQEQISRTLEYAYDDFCLAQVAKALGKEEDYEELMKRSENYRNVIDPRTGYAQGRYANGDFLDEANAFQFATFITEGAPCHYTWYVPHNPQGLMECMGGKEHYVAKLDSMFNQGRYWHGNEPCHQVAYMFNYAGEAWKTQKAVRHIMETEYHNGPGGLSGNDDAGQMSAWYLFAAMGFYPVCPGTPWYAIASPSFPELSIEVGNNRVFKIIAHHASEKNIYIQKAKLNGKAYDYAFIHHNDIVAGGVLEVEMGAKPNSDWGKDTNNIYR